MFLKINCIVLAVTLSLSESYNILIAYPHPGKSHFLVFEQFFKSLAERGHNVTVISFFPQKKKIPNYTDISLVDKTQQWVNVLDLPNFQNSRFEKYTAAIVVKEFAYETCLNGLSNGNFQRFLKEDNKFDLVLAEFFNTNCFMGLARRFQAPLIGLSSCGTLPWVSPWFGTPENPSYIPVIYMDYSDHLTFLQRVENSVILLVNKLLFKYYMDNPGNEFSKKYLGEDLHEGTSIMYNASLLLVNSHFSLYKPRPFVPSIIEVGGIHIGEPKQLPASLQKWIDDSPEGVIYFSLGSMIKGHSFPTDKRIAFLNAFKRLPQRVLWKWETDSMEDKPDNVMIQKWMPQADILCHPNVRAFIAHGGLLGVTEAVHCGVPVIVMPQFADQFFNGKVLEENGGGVILYLREATEDAIYTKLKEILSPDFRQKTKDLSERFRDRPLPPLKTAIYWVEYVARHRGAPHMRTAAVDMPFYKFYLIDVMAFLLLVFGLFVFSLFFVSKLILRCLFRRSNAKMKTS